MQFDEMSSEFGLDCFCCVQITFITHVIASRAPSSFPEPTIFWSAVGSFNNKKKTLGLWGRECARAGKEILARNTRKAPTMVNTNKC